MESNNEEELDSDTSSSSGNYFFENACNYVNNNIASNSTDVDSSDEFQCSESVDNYSHGNVSISKINDKRSGADDTKMYAITDDRIGENISNDRGIKQTSDTNINLNSVHSLKSTKLEDLCTLKTNDVTKEYPNTLNDAPGLNLDDLYTTADTSGLEVDASSTLNNTMATGNRMENLVNPCKASPWDVIDDSDTSSSSGGDFFENPCNFVYNNIASNSTDDDSSNEFQCSESVDNYSHGNVSRLKINDKCSGSDDTNMYAITDDRIGKNVSNDRGIKQTSDTNINLNPVHSLKSTKLEDLCTLKTNDVTKEYPNTLNDAPGLNLDDLYTTADTSGLEVDASSTLNNTMATGNRMENLVKPCKASPWDVIDDSDTSSSSGGDFFENPCNFVYNNIASNSTDADSSDEFHCSESVDNYLHGNVSTSKINDKRSGTDDTKMYAITDDRKGVNVSNDRSIKRSSDTNINSNVYSAKRKKLEEVFTLKTNDMTKEYPNILNDAPGLTLDDSYTTAEKSGLEVDASSTLNNTMATGNQIENLVKPCKSSPWDDIDDSFLKDAPLLKTGDTSASTLTSAIEMGQCNGEHISEKQDSKLYPSGARPKEYSNIGVTTIGSKDLTQHGIFQRESCKVDKHHDNNIQCLISVAQHLSSKFLDWATERKPNRPETTKYEDNIYGNLSVAGDNECKNNVTTETDSSDDLDGNWRTILKEVVCKINRPDTGRSADDCDWMFKGLLKMMSWFDGNELGLPELFAAINESDISEEYPVVNGFIDIVKGMFKIYDWKDIDAEPDKVSCGIDRMAHCCDIVCGVLKIISCFILKLNQHVDEDGSQDSNSLHRKLFQGFIDFETYMTEKEFRDSRISTDDQMNMKTNETKSNTETLFIYLYKMASNCIYWINKESIYLTDDSVKRKCAGKHLPDCDLGAIVKIFELIKNTLPVGMYDVINSFTQIITAVLKLISHVKNNEKISKEFIFEIIYCLKDCCKIMGDNYRRDDQNLEKDSCEQSILMKVTQAIGNHSKEMESMWLNAVTYSITRFLFILQTPVTIQLKTYVFGEEKVKEMTLLGLICKEGGCHLTKSDELQEMVFKLLKLFDIKCITPEIQTIESNMGWHNPRVLPNTLVSVYTSVEHDTPHCAGQGLHLSSSQNDRYDKVINILWFKYQKQFAKLKCHHVISNIGGILTSVWHDMIYYFLSRINEDTDDILSIFTSVRLGILSGSSVECSENMFKSGNCDTDLMFTMHKYTNPANPVMETIKNKPANIMLKIDATQSKTTCEFDKYLANEDNYIRPDIFRMHFHKVVHDIFSVITRVHSVSSKSVNCSFVFGDLAYSIFNLTRKGNLISSLDIVPCIELGFWPEQAKDWIHRKAAWPELALRTQIAFGGCHIVPKSSISDLEWRFSFSKAEEVLCKHFSKSQAFHFSLFKTQFDKVKLIGASEILLSNNFKKRKNIFHTYHSKTAMFWFCEKHPAEDSIWSKQNVFCCQYMLLEMSEEMMREGNLPHYFIPGHNLLDEVPNRQLLQQAVEELGYLKRQAHSPDGVLYQEIIKEIENEVEK